MAIIKNVWDEAAQKYAYYKNLYQQRISEPVTQSEHKQALQYYQLYQNTTSLERSFFQLYNHRVFAHNAKIALDSIPSDKIMEAQQKMFKKELNLINLETRDKLLLCSGFLMSRSILKSREQDRVEQIQKIMQFQVQQRIVQAFKFYSVVYVLIFLIFQMILSLEKISRVDHAVCHIHEIFIDPAYHSPLDIELAIRKFPSFMSSLTQYILIKLFSEQTINYIAYTMSEHWFSFLLQLTIFTIFLFLFNSQFRKTYLRKDRYRRVEAFIEEKALEEKDNVRLLKKLDWVVNNNNNL